MSGLRIIARNGVWHATGTVAGDRVRQSLGTRDKAQAEELRAALEARLWKRHTYGEEAVRTFEEAALKYLQAGGEGRFVPPILHHYKGRNVATIKPGELREAALTIYPKGTAATRNRQAVTPARSIINHAASLGWCQPIKVDLFPVPQSRKHKPVSRAWIEAFMRQADQDSLPHLSAIVLFMNQTGARVSEAVRLEGQHVDLGSRIALLERTKTDEWSARYLTAELALRIGALGMTHGSPVFRYTDPKAVNRRIAAVCARAKIEARTTHSAGRHSFGTNAMNVPGASIKAAMEAGGWKSVSLFLRTYVHAEDGGREIAAKFDAQTGTIGTDLTRDRRAKGYRFGKKA